MSGTVRTYRSSAFAERAFCGTCGTHLWFREDGRDHELMPGLFAGADKMPLAREVYADCAPSYLPLAGGHARVDRADYERDHPFVEGDAP